MIHQSDLVLLGHHYVTTIAINTIIIVPAQVIAIS